MPSLAMEQVVGAALKVTQILSDKGLESCLSGGVACASYGCTQVPNTIDIVVLTDKHTVDEIKALISAEDPEDFFIHETHGDSNKPAHTTLYCKIERRLACKVVILVPGSMGLTIIPAARMHHSTINGHSIVALPSILLLLLRLKAWDDHRKSTFPEERWKQYADTDDVNQMVGAAVEKGDHLMDCFWVPAESVGLGKKLFREFAKHSLVSDINLWNRIGFSRFEFY